jgi:hypothetical protein
MRQLDFCQLFMAGYPMNNFIESFILVHSQSPG